MPKSVVVIMITLVHDVRGGFAEGWGSARSKGAWYLTLVPACTVHTCPCAYGVRTLIWASAVPLWGVTQLDGRCFMTCPVVVPHLHTGLVCVLISTITSVFPGSMHKLIDTAVRYLWANISLKTTTCSAKPGTLCSAHLLQLSLEQCPTRTVSSTCM